MENNEQSAMINEQSAMINEQSAINNQQAIISNQQSAINYIETHANKMYSGAIASNHGVKHIASAFYLAKQAGVNIYEVRLKRAEERRKQREKLANLQTCTGGTFPRGGACVHYYIRENTVNDATNTDNTNIDCDDEAFENIPDSLPGHGGCHRQYTITIRQNNVWRQMDVS